MSKRLYVVMNPFTASHISGGQRLLNTGEELFAEYPISHSRRIVVFEQDNEEFEVDAGTFDSHTELKELKEVLDKNDVVIRQAPIVSCKAKGCGHKQQSHTDGRGACTACSCKKFEP